MRQISNKPKEKPLDANKELNGRKIRLMYDYLLVRKSRRTKLTKLTNNLYL